MGFGYEIPIGENHEPDLDAFDAQEALDAALKTALHLETDCINSVAVTAAWARVSALSALAT